LLRPTRAASVPREVFGDQPLPGVLVVDRDAGCNRAVFLYKSVYGILPGSRGFV
jgi:hypothetical protein